MSTNNTPKTEETALAKPAKRGAPEANLNALKHGAFATSKKVLQLRRRRIQWRVRMMFDGDKRSGAQPIAWWLTEADRPLAMSWSWARDMVDCMSSQLEMVGILAGSKDGDLAVRSLADKLEGWIKTEAMLSDRLCLNPAARAKLGLDAAKGQFIKQKLAESIANDNHD